jgi:DNA-directed RNA polymerase specialized sigma24 family protein
MMRKDPSQPVAQIPIEVLTAAGTGADALTDRVEGYIKKPMLIGARAMVRDDAEAEDIVQYAHVTAYRMLPQFRGDASYATWLTRIAINEAFGRTLQKKRLHVLSLEHSGGETSRVRHALQATFSEALTSTSDVFHFAGERCDRITRAVLQELELNADHL